MIRIKKWSLVVITFLILFSFSSYLSSAVAQSIIPSLGKGACEVILFSDYFCPPCKKVDTQAEPLMKELLATGKVKIIFVDVPFHRGTTIYARHYLYAVNAGADDERIFHIRKVLFQAAQEKRIETQEALLGYLKERKIVWKAYDEKPIFSMMSQIIKQYQIDQTPTCVIRYSLTDEKKYIGKEEIWNGLTELKMRLMIGKK